MTLTRVIFKIKKKKKKRKGRTHDTGGSKIVRWEFCSFNFITLNNKRFMYTLLLFFCSLYPATNTTIIITTTAHHPSHY